MVLKLVSLPIELRNHELKQSLRQAEIHQTFRKVCNTAFDILVCLATPQSAEFFMLPKDSKVGVIY